MLHMTKTEERRRAITAVYLLLRKGDTFLLARRCNTGYQDGNYDLPAGHVDAGEVPFMALIREAKEELGITLKTEDLHFVHVNFTVEHDNSHGDRVDFFFEASIWEGELKIMEPDKCDAHVWVGFDELPENTVARIRKVLANIRHKELFSENSLEDLRKMMYKV